MVHLKQTLDKYIFLTTYRVLNIIQRFFYQYYSLKLLFHQLHILNSIIGMYLHLIYVNGYVDTRFLLNVC